MNDMPNEMEHGQKKSGNKLLIFGGLGCGLLLLLCLGGMGAAYYFGNGFAQDVVQEMASIEGSLMNSEEVIAAVGSPVKVVPGKPTNSTTGGENLMILSGTVSGPDGEGTYEATFTVEGIEGIDLQSLRVVADGKEFNVGTEDELDLGIELGE